MADLPTATTVTPTTLKKILTALKIGAGALIASNALADAPGWVTQLLGALVAVLAFLGYGSSSAQLAKLGKAALVSLLVGGMFYAGCATLHTMSGAFATCAKADLGQIVTAEGQTLAQDVTALLDGNTATLESDLLALAGKVGLDAVECAVAAYESTRPTSGSAVAAMSVPTPTGLQRAKAWLAKQRSAGK